MKINFLKVRGRKLSEFRNKDVLVAKAGREQILALVKRGLSVPVAML